MIGASQREILDALIELYDKKKDAVKGEDISRILNRSPGTIRNQMQTLRALGYVEGVPGPKGGYIPSINAYRTLNIKPVENPYDVPIYMNGEMVEGISAQKIIFTKITHPNECEVIVRLTGDTRKIEAGSTITIGPTPVNHIIIKGIVFGREDTKKELLIATESITSIPKSSINNITTKDIITVSPDMDIKACARKLLENRINAAPVVKGGLLEGIITIKEIVRSFTECKNATVVRDILIKDIFTIDNSKTVFECIKKMQELDVGRLIVMDSNKPVGIVTRTDILKSIIG